MRNGDLTLKFSESKRKENERHLNLVNFKVIGEADTHQKLSKRVKSMRVSESW